MKNRLKIVMTMTIAIIASQVYGQVRIVNSATNSAAINSSAFIDASSNSTTNPTNNIGKGLIFPRTDLTTFSAFSGIPVGLGTSYPTRFDGMIVYNTGTGSTLASASDSIVSVTPGFYYYDNKTTNIKGGKWTRIDATATDISKLLVQSPAKDSIISVVSSNGKTLSNGNGILINESNSLAKSVLADASLRIDSTAIATMIGQSPVKDSVANVVTNLINQNKVAGKALTNGNGIIVTGGDSSVLKATSLRIDSSAIAKFVGQSPMKDSLTALINSTAPKTPDSTTSSNGLTMTGKDIRLGGSLTAATTVTTSATNTLTIAGLQSGTTADSIVMISSTGVLKRMATSVMSDKTQTNNGLSKSGDTVQLGGTLTKATTITTSATNTLALAGLQSGSVSDSVITWDASTSILKKRTASSLASTLPFKTVTSSYAVDVNDYTINCNYSAAGSLTLPSASANTGRMLRILVQNGDVTFLPSLKDGATTVATMHSGTMVSNGITQDNKVTIQSDGTDWWIVGQ